MHPARYPALFALLALLFVSVRAAETKPDSRTQSGKLSTVRLLKTGRLPAKDSPGGMGFLFLVTPVTDANSAFAIKETKDFRIAGGSYQEKTQAELGKRFEPGTEVHDADKFFTDNPRLKPSGIDTPKGSRVISLLIRGGALPSDVKAAEITLHVGYDKQAEAFTFTVPVPAG